MSGLSLSQEDRELLGDWWDEGTESDLTWDLSTLAPVVERIATRAVNQALTEAADAIERHRRELDRAGQISFATGCYRAERIVRARTT